MDKLTIAELEAIDRIKIDSVIALLLRKGIIKHSELDEQYKKRVDSLEDDDRKERIGRYLRVR